MLFCIKNHEEYCAIQIKSRGDATVRGEKYTSENTQRCEVAKKTR